MQITFVQIRFTSIKSSEMEHKTNPLLKKSLKNENKT